MSIEKPLKHLGKFKPCLTFLLFLPSFKKVKMLPEV